jgi:hypothetical protein
MRSQQSVTASRGLFSRYVTRFDDGEIVRCAFLGLLAGAIAVIALDLKALYDEIPLLDPIATGTPVVVEPALPPMVRPGGAFETTLDPRENVTGDRDAMRRPLSFELRANGVMAVEGTIDLGSAKRLEAELASRGEYVRTLSINSPGGSLEDAMAMARLARQRGLATEIGDGALCASSCPLLFTGGVERSAGSKAAVGLHQFYSATDLTNTNPAQAMSDAQATAARIARYLQEMGVDPSLWLHALDTPPQALYYLSNEQMKTYRLVTTGTKLASR